MMYKKSQIGPAEQIKLCKKIVNQFSKMSTVGMAQLATASITKKFKIKHKK